MIDCYFGDCLDILPKLKDKSVDLVIADLPYEKVEQQWDKIIDMAKLWPELNRVCVDDAAIIMFGSQPFTSLVITSNLKNFKYTWVWRKDKGSNFAQVKRSPFKEHEDIAVFSTGRAATKYFPIMEERNGNGLNLIGSDYIGNSKPSKKDIYGGRMTPQKKTVSKLRYPSSVQKFNREGGWFATQKPVALLEYLIKTYSKTGTILDPTAGSMSLAIACSNLKRDCICIEKDPENFQIGIDRLTSEKITFNKYE